MMRLLTRAEPFRRQVLESCRQSLGGAHPRTGKAHLALAECLEAMGRRPEAEGFRKQGLKTLCTALGDDHPTTARAHVGLAQCLLLPTDARRIVTGCLSRRAR